MSTNTYVPSRYILLSNEGVFLEGWIMPLLVAISEYFILACSKNAHSFYTAIQSSSVDQEAAFLFPLKALMVLQRDS